MQVKELVNTFLETHGFPQCIEAINCTHIEIKEPNQHYSDYFNRIEYCSINVQAIFLLLILSSRCVNEVSRQCSQVQNIFVNSSVTKRLRKREIRKCEKVLVEGYPSIPICLIGDPAYPLLPFIMKNIQGGGKKQREKYFGYKLSSA